MKQVNSSHRFRQACLAMVCLFLPAILTAQSLGIRLDGEQLRVAAPQLQFLSSEVLQRLHNGIAVQFVFKIGIAPDRLAKPTMEVSYRFVISYDIFEEKIAVNRIEPNPRSITHLSEAAAQLWCLDSIALSTARLTADQPFWVLLDYRTEEPRASTTESAESGASLIGQLIDVFSRKNQRQESRGALTGGPFRLSELRRNR